jgi:hypothetical protein
MLLPIEGIHEMRRFVAIIAVGLVAALFLVLGPAVTSQEKPSSVVLEKSI